MRHGIHPLTGEPQPLYFSDDHPTMPGWFKGMEQIIRERVFGQRQVYLLSAQALNALG